MKQATAQTETYYQPGQFVMVECYDNKIKKSAWHLGKFIKSVSATDRPHRFNCTLSNGIEIREAAPECVRPATILELIKEGVNIELATPYERKYNVQDAPGHYDGQVKKHGDTARVYCLYAINENDNIGMVYCYDAWGRINNEIKPLTNLIPLQK